MKIRKYRQRMRINIYTVIVKDRLAIGTAINTFRRSSKIHHSEWDWDGLHIICIGQREAPCQNGIFISIPKRPKIDFGRAKSRVIASTDRITASDRNSLTYDGQTFVMIKTHTLANNKYAQTCILLETKMFYFYVPISWFYL